MAARRGAEAAVGIDAVVAHLLEDGAAALACLGLLVKLGIRKENIVVTDIKGVVCGVRVEDVAEPLMREIRYLDKLIDELAKGKAMAKILRG